MITGNLIESLVETVEKVEASGDNILFHAWQRLYREGMSKGFSPELRDAIGLLRDRWLGCEPTGIEAGR